MHRADHFGGHLDLDVPRPAPARHGDDPLVERHAEVDVHIEVVVEEAVDVAIVERLGAEHVRPRLEAGDDEVAVRRSG